MSWYANPFALLLLFSTFVSVTLAIYAWGQREMEGGKFFSLFMFSAALWALGDFFLIGALDPAIKVWGLKIKPAGAFPMAVFFAFFVFDYTGNKWWVNRRNLILLSILPAITLLMVWTLDAPTLFLEVEGLSADGPFLLLQTSKGVLFWLSMVYSSLLIVIGLVGLIRVSLHVAPIYRNQAYLILVAVLIPATINLLFQLGFHPFLDFNLTSALFGITGLMIAWALYRFRFLEITPVARKLIIENMRDGMFVLDIQNRIVDINPAMLAYLGKSASDVLGQPAGEVLSPWKDLVTRFGDETNMQREVIADRDGTRHDYELQISPITDQYGKTTGRLVILRDISRRRETLAQLERYADQNARLLAQELRQRQLAESLRQTMIIISSSLEHDAIVAEILAQLRKVIPYYSAALYLLEGDDLKLVRVVGPESITGQSYTTPRRYDQVKKIFKLQRAEVFLSAFSGLQEARDEPVYSSMAAPLVVGQEALGVLTIDRFEPQPFSQEDAEILQAFTNQAAIAVKNAEYHDEARTAVALDERNRLAQDLHDAVNQTLFTASIMAEALPRVWEQNPEQGRQGLEEIRQLTRGALAEMRTLLMELRPQGITEKSLGDLLDHLTRAISSRTRIPIEFEIENDTILPPDVQVIFYRIAQEAFNNIARHAKASNVVVQLNAWPDQASLVIRDNGEGFRIDEVAPGHMGLTIMRERASQIGAGLWVKSQPNQGTEISVRWQKG